MQKRALLISEGRQREREKERKRGCRGGRGGEKVRLHRLNFGLMKDIASPLDEQESVSRWHG